jgi:hypothetical protein
MNVLHGFNSLHHPRTHKHFWENLCLFWENLCLFWENLRAIGSVFTLSNPLTDYLVDCVLSSMAPVVRIEPNDVQTLLLFDNAHEYLESNGWLFFIQKFKGFNLAVTQQFSLTFDGCRAKVGDIQLELNK